LRQHLPNIAERAAAYGLPAERIEDNDVLRIRERVGVAVAQCRQGKGPHFFECMTYRWKEHVGPNDDFQLGYRSATEVEPWKKNDQVKRLAGMVDAEPRKRIEAEVETEVSEAFAFAEASRFPEESELFADVYKD